MKIVGAILTFLVLCFSLIWINAPLLREKVWWLGITPLSPNPVQSFSLEKLRDYPTRATAMALVLYANLKHASPRSEAELQAQAARACEQETDPTQSQSCKEKELARLQDEERERAPAREKTNKIAEGAIETLCVLSGESFGTYFEKNQWGGHTWGSLDDQRWGQALGEVNLWALHHFGTEALAAAGLSEIASEIKIEVKMVNAEDAGTSAITIAMDAGTSTTDETTGSTP